MPLGEVEVMQNYLRMYSGLQKDREKLGKIGKTETGFDKRLEQQFV